MTLGDYSPAVLAAPGAQGPGGAGERLVVNTQSSPSESLQVKWQCLSLKSICAAHRGRRILKNKAGGMLLL